MVDALGAGGEPGGGEFDAGPVRCAGRLEDPRHRGHGVGPAAFAIGVLEGVQAFPEGGPVLTVEPFAQRVGQGLADLAVGPCVGLVAKRLEPARGIVAAGGGLTVRALMHGDAPALRVEDLDLEGAEADDDLTSRVGRIGGIPVFPSTVTLPYLSALMRSHLTTSNGFAGKGSKALRSASNRPASLSPLR